jgi:hypothetical protein
MPNSPRNSLQRNGAVVGAGMLQDKPAHCLVDLWAAQKTPAARVGLLLDPRAGFPQLTKGGRRVLDILFGPGRD